MLPHALESNVLALEIQSQLRTDPGTAYGALVDYRYLASRGGSGMRRSSHKARDGVSYRYYRQACTTVFIISRGVADQ